MDPLLKTLGVATILVGVGVVWFLWRHVAGATQAVPTSAAVFAIVGVGVTLIVVGVGVLRRSFWLGLVPGLGLCALVVGVAVWFMIAPDSPERGLFYLPFLVLGAAVAALLVVSRRWFEHR